MRDKETTSTPTMNLHLKCDSFQIYQIMSPVGKQTSLGLFNAPQKEQNVHDRTDLMGNLKNFDGDPIESYIGAYIHQSLHRANTSEHETDQRREDTKCCRGVLYTTILLLLICLCLYYVLLLFALRVL